MRLAEAARQAPSGSGAASAKRERHGKRRTGALYLYRSSKAAVNQVVKSLSIDLKQFGINVVALHPGWVQTDMGGANASINTHTSVNGLRQVITKIVPANSGQFINYDGTAIAW